GVDLLRSRSDRNGCRLGCGAPQPSEAKSWRRLADRDDMAELHAGRGRQGLRLPARVSDGLLPRLVEQWRRIGHRELDADEHVSSLLDHLVEKPAEDGEVSHLHTDLVVDLVAEYLWLLGRIWSDRATAGENGEARGLDILLGNPQRRHGLLKLFHARRVLGQRLRGGCRLRDDAGGDLGGIRAGRDGPGPDDRDRRYRRSWRRRRPRLARGDERLGEDEAREKSGDSSTGARH